jgi:hypothetical protein
VTTMGRLGLGWLAAPDFNNTPSAIVKRDSHRTFPLTFTVDSCL